MPKQSRRFFCLPRAAVLRGRILLLLVVAVLTSPRPSPSQTAPASDPTPLAVILSKLDRGSTEDAERYIKENPAVMKQRLEGVLQEIDQSFDELGRFGATGRHGADSGPAFQGMMETLLEKDRRYEKLFDVYRRVAGDATLYTRLQARLLRIEGAYHTWRGEYVCGDQLDWEEAQKSYRLALERLEAGFALARQVNDLRVMASAKNNIGSTYIRLIQPEQAIQAYSEGLRYAERMPGDMYRGLVRLNLGNTYVWLGEPGQSYAHLQPALASFKRMGRGTWEANALLTIGNAYLRDQKFSTAWETLTLAVERAKQSGEDKVRGRALLNLGMAAMALQRKEAIPLMEEALDWFSKQGPEVYVPIEREAVLQDGLMLLSRAAEQAGDAARAEQYKKRFFESVGLDPDRYQTVRSSPCFAIYKGRSRTEKPVQQ